MFKYTYDAWNRLVKVEHAGQSGTTRVTVVLYTYDGTGRRVGKTLTYRGDLDGTEHYYYDGSKQIEMRQVLSGQEAVMRQYLWGTQYVDEIVRVDINGDYLSNNDCLGAADASYYYHQDANWNVVAVTDNTGAVVQRISYSAYGLPSMTDSSGRSRCAPTFGPSGNQPHTSAVAWQGLFCDLETGHSYNRARTLDHRLGRFMQRDPLEYGDGMSLYEYLCGSPLKFTDPLGCLPVPVHNKYWTIAALQSRTADPGKNPRQAAKTAKRPVSGKRCTCAVRLVATLSSWFGPFAGHLACPRRVPRPCYNIFGDVDFGSDDSDVDPGDFSPFQTCPTPQEQFEALLEKLNAPDPGPLVCDYTYTCPSVAPVILYTIPNSRVVAPTWGPRFPSFSLPAVFTSYLCNYVCSRTAATKVSGPASAQCFTGSSTVISVKHFRCHNVTCGPITRRYRVTYEPNNVHEKRL